MHSMRNDDQVIVTGASSGIGSALARRLAADGRRLVLVGRDVERLAATADDCRSLGAMDVRTVALDLRDRTLFGDVVCEIEREGPIGLFVACAGILSGRRDGQAIESAESTHTVLDTNLLATVDAVNAVLPGMLGLGRGQVLLVASLAAFAPLADAPAYSASKAGLLSWGLAMRDALVGRGVTFTVACPGYVTTPMTARHIGRQPGRIDAAAAAERILDGLSRKRTIVAFPFLLGWLSRLALLAPTFLRRLGMRATRFHVGE